MTTTPYCDDRVSGQGHRGKASKFTFVTNSFTKQQLSVVTPSEKSRPSTTTPKPGFDSLIWGCLVSEVTVSMVVADMMKVELNCL